MLCVQLFFSGKAFEARVQVAQSHWPGRTLYTAFEMWWHTRRNQISSFARNGRVHLNRPVGRQFSRTTGSRGVRISGSNAGYTMFRGSVKGTGYPLHSPVFPFTSPPVRHRVPSHFNWTLPRTSCGTPRQIYLDTLTPWAHFAIKFKKTGVFTKIKKLTIVINSI